MRDFDWKILYELYKNPNMTKVADLLYISQPSLSKRIQNMEEEFDISIFNRTSQGLEFTKEGEYLANRAKIYLDFIVDTENKLHEIKTTEEKEIIIGSAYTYTRYELLDILSEYYGTNSDVNIKIVNEQSNILFRKVLEDEIDLAFVRGDYEGKFERILVAEDNCYLVSKNPLEISEIPNKSRIDFKTNDKSLELIKNWWEEEFKFSMEPKTSVKYLDFALNLVSKDLGYLICFLPKNYKNDLGLNLKPLYYKDESPVTRKSWLIYLKSRREKKIVSKFIDFIDERYKI
ncbi:LysR family transcriptional regulator [Peptoniphilus sp. MSJ-1]|uniref:LysR family transcriptional regulator n=1 Tax=Peptoniphilus ovalis TaxID=2841503 RepID=A0ABS6FIA2_9FIRM|nr:LysR family transcriptional regulator [Peptoniphilus ovalis]MBU5669163.1 LysR family transcriptional regulator [Peptoniphilus ovalis]